MRRRAAKVDANQAQVVTGFRSAGATVQSLANIGQGCPDLLVGYRGRNYLIEVKDGSKPPSARTLTDDQQEWTQNWRGQWEIVQDLSDVKRLVIQWTTT